MPFHYHPSRINENPRTGTGVCLPLIMSKSQRIRIKSSIAIELGLKLNSSNRYRLNAGQLDDYNRIQQIYNEQEEIDAFDASYKETGHTAMEAEAKVIGLPVANVKQYWYKGSRFSIQVAANKPEPIDFNEIIDNLTERIKKHIPKYETFSRTTTLEDPHLLIIDPADIHFGKLASAYETGENYSIDIAKQRVIEGFNGILNKSKAFNIEKVLIVVGNDVLHVDNARSTTTSGTFQDSDVMFYDMFNIALETFVGLIESIVSDYDVDIVFNPSNHDYASGWMFARTLDTWFRNTENVNVVSDISHRKYYQYGLNMIGLSHGDGGKMADLPLTMANESPRMWADTKFRHIYLHHIHHKQTTKFQSGKDFIGVTVEYLRSPSSADSWHHRNQYCGGKKAIEGFIHSKENGQCARLSHYF